MFRMYQLKSKIEKICKTEYFRNVPTLLFISDCQRKWTYALTMTSTELSNTSTYSLVIKMNLPKILCTFTLTLLTSSNAFSLTMG